jgi:hypothetical protein
MVWFFARLFLFNTYFFMSKIKHLMASLLISFMGITVACNSSEVDVNAGKDTLMLINAAPDAAGIDFTFNKQKINTLPLTYTQNPVYTLIDAGVKQVEVSIAPSVNKLLSVPVLLQSRKVYSIFFAGSVNNRNVLLVATQDNLKKPDKNKAKYRFINLSPNSRTLDFRLANDSLLIGNLPFGVASDFNQIKPGEYSVKIASRDTSIKSTVAINFNFVNGKIYTFWAKGFVKGTGNQTLGIQSIQNK